MKRWEYKSENLDGNLHAAAAWLTKHHPEWDVVALQYNGGNHTVVVYRLQEPGLDDCEDDGG